MSDHDQSLTDDEALACLLAQPDGRTETSVSALARRWHWNRTRAFRGLKRWENDGYIARAAGPDGRSVITAMIPSVRRPDADGNTPRNQRPETSIAAVANISAQWAEEAERALSADARPSYCGKLRICRARRHDRLVRH